MEYSGDYKTTYIHRPWSEWESAKLCPRCKIIYGMFCCDVKCCSECGMHENINVSVRSLYKKTLIEYGPISGFFAKLFRLDLYDYEYVGYRIQDKDCVILEVENNGKGIKCNINGKVE